MLLDLPQKSLSGFCVCVQQYWAGQGVYQYVPVEQFGEAFKNSPVGARNAEALAQPFDKALHKKEALIYTNRSLTGACCRPVSFLLINLENMIINLIQ